MASITSLMNSTSSTSSIYGTRNVLSGLATGMDTESMIENAVSGIKKKIQSLYQKRTKIEWQQEAYRSIIDKAVNFNNKYTSYSSKTNLLSSSFFSNAVINTVNGTYANKVTASGKTSSDIKINSVKQMATAASYTVSGSSIGLGSSLAAANGSGAVGILGESFDLGGQLDINNMSGTLTFQYGGSNGASFDIKFDELVMGLMHYRKFKSPIILDTEVRSESAYLGEADLKYLLDKEGITTTDLRPAGRGDFDARN